MKLEDNICPICLYIFIQPVTMPCEHELCLTCFKQNVEEANFCCPLCRIRISTWARRASRNNTLVNQKRWEEIQLHFPENVKRRLNGEEEEDEEMKALNVSIKLSEPGEIRGEYEAQLKKLREQRAEERRKEQEASEKLIKQIQEEEERKRKELEKLEKEDELLAKELSQSAANSPYGHNTRSATSDNNSGSNCASLEPYIDSRPENGLSKSPYPYRCLTPIGSGAGKLCVDREKVQALEEKFQRQKIRRDKNLITTQDIANLEEQFKVNKSRAVSKTEGVDIDCLRRVPEAMATLPNTLSTVSIASLNQNEILKQMSEDLDMSTKEVEEDQDEVSITFTASETESKRHSVILISDDSCRSKSAMSIHTEGQDRCTSTQSSDSITQELNHFRPIRACPLTPPRRLPSGKLVEPQLIRTTPRNLSKCGFSSPHETNLSDIDAGSPIMQRRLSELAEERKDQVNRMSKSTCTGEGQTTLDDENKNPDDTAIGEAHRSSARCTISTSRNAEFKDISNSPLNKRHFDFSNIDSEESGAKKKLIIPLEPSLGEDDIIISHPLDISKYQKSSQEVLLGKKTENPKRSKLSRTRKGSSGKVRYSIEEGSPQPSVIDWIKKGGNSVKTCDNVNDLIANGRDEVDGVSEFSETRNERLANKGCSRDAITSGVCNLSSRSQRARKRLRDEDFVYETVNGKSAGKRAKANTSAIELDSSRDGFCSDMGSEGSEDFLEVSPAKKKPKENGKWKMQESVKPMSKLTRPALHQPKKSLKKSKSDRGARSKSSKTMHDFFKAKDMRDDTDKCEGESVPDQEELDRKLALELQKQFELEAKLNLNSLRFKGNSNEYSFRVNRKRRTLVDA